MTDCVTSSSRRLFTRSAITPPKSVKNRNGIDPAKPTTPSQNAELVSVSTSQPWATFCIQVPMFERKLPLQNSRKFAIAQRADHLRQLRCSGSGKSRCTMAEGSSAAAARFSFIQLWSVCSEGDLPDL